MESVLTSLKSSSQLTLKDIVNAEALTPDLVSVDVSIASDGSFVETASGPAAREIKRHFDQLYGVSLSVRSPYAITAFVNQHGKQMFRVGNRELSAPGAAGQEAEGRLSEAQILAKSNDPSSPPRSQQRRSRLSMHHIFSQNAIFKPTPSGVLSSNPSPTTHTTMFSRPDTASSGTLGHRKLRKTRSFGPGDQPGYQNQHFIYHQQGGAAEPGSSSSATTFTGRGHSQSVTSADASSRYTSLATLAPPSTSHITYSSTTTFVSTNPSTSSNSGSTSMRKNNGIPQSSILLQQSSQPNWQSVPSSDIFAEVMKWGMSGSPRRRSFTNPSTTSLSSSTASRSHESSAHSSSGYERSVVSGVSSNKGQRDRTFLQHPFGIGVVFDSPVRRTPLSRTKSGTGGSDQDVSPTSDNSALPQGGLSGVTTPGDPKMWSGDPQVPHRLVVGPVKMLREMQSFESTMTARQIDIEPSTTRGTPVSSSPHSPLRQRYSDLSDGYSDNPNLRRPPSAVLLRNIVPAISTETVQVDNNFDETHEAEDAASSSIATADTEANLRPQTPIKLTTALPEDLVSSGTADDVQSHLASAMSESIKLDDNNDGCVEDTARSTPVPEIQYHNPASQPDMTTAIEGRHISRYTNASDTFEVLQTYTGLPLLDRLPAGSQKKSKKRANANSTGVIWNNDDMVSRGTEVGDGDEGDDGDDADEEDMMVETTVIRMSLTTKEETAAPRDDPRFVMWGWVDKSTKVKGNEKVESKQKKRRTWRESIISGSEGDGQSDHFGTESSGKGSKKSHRSVGSKWSKRDKKEEKGKVTNEFGVVTSRDGDDNESQGGESSDNRAGDTSLEGKKVLIAATIERWVAQLTSEIDYDELLNFFLTYRTYVSATELCRVLMGRFYWTLQSAEEDEGNGAKNGRVYDERVRRIVRVRTFVAIRCWILTFWMVDFVPNRELRLLLADFLNQLNKDPLLKRHVDGLDIVKKLIKIARECKTEYLGTMLEKTAHNGLRVEQSDQSTALPVVRNESDLDLDFLPDVQSALRHGYGYGYPTKHGRASHLPAGVIASNFAIGPMSTLGRVVDVANHAPGSVGPFEHPPYLRVDHQQHQGPLSRVVVRTIGRLKRALNARTTSTLVSQTAADNITGVPEPLGQFEVSAFEVDMSGDGSGSIRSGVEGYSTPTLLSTRVDAKPAPAITVDTPTAMQAFTTSQDPPLSHVLPPLTLPPSSHPIDESGISQTSPTEQTNVQDDPYSGSATMNDRPISVGTTATTDSSKSAPASAPLPTISRGADTIAVQDVPDVSGVGEMQEVENDPEQNGGIVEGSMADIEDFSDVNADTEAEPERAESIRSTSTDSFGVPLTASRGPPPLFANTQSPWQFDIVSIDDLDLSDTSSDKGLCAPPGLRKPIRKLPKRPLFWPRESVSSMGIISHDSMASGPSSSGMSSPAPAGLGGKVEPWQLQDLLKSLRADEEEDGGVDSALKKLEGYIDPQKQEEKTKNVNEWITSIQERMKAGDYSMDVDDPRFSHLASGEEIIEFDNAENSSKRGSVNGRESPTPPDTAPESATESEPDSTSSQILRTPDRPTVSTPLLQKASSPGCPTESLRVVDSKHIHEDVVPFDVLQNKVQAFPSPVPASSTFKHQPLPRLHQSFVVHHRAELLAQHFAMIDRELFMSIRFEELVNAEWTACQEVDVLDWNQYLKDRARWKAEQRLPEKTSALAAVRARFNLMTNFVISEVVLTPPSARHLVFKKFLTIAYKSYLMHNFHALTAIVTGLNNDLVYKALGRQWNRIGRREHRMFSDFQQLISNVDGFKYMRNMIDSIAQSKPPDDSSHTASVVSGGTDSKHKSDTKPPHFCIPFIGVYLSQLYRLTKLPDLVDPTAPNLAVEVDPSTSAFDQPRYPDVFSALAPLPPFIQLEPLINVHKQRQIAAVIKSLIAGQHLASHVHYEIDKKLFQKCLRLRASDMTTLHHVLMVYPD